MKYHRFFSHLFLAVGCMSAPLFAVDEVEEVFSMPRSDCLYVRLGATSVNPYEGSFPIPDVAVGKRFANETSAIDVSVSGAYGYDDPENRKSVSYLYNLPKLQIISYPMASNFYYGGGLGYTGLEDQKTDTKFQGISTNFTMGYQLSQTGRWQHGLQFECIQPTLAISRMNTYMPPSLTLTYSFGF